ncbi:MAG: tail fiber domain-containing protein [Leclercia adecarboxylata]|nr:tail fiber domain-containing protein [Leclercia adecarboxylata]
MTKYATNHPIGSMDPKDLFDNAQNLDYALNDITKAIWTDRFGRSRKSYWGMEQAFSAQLLNQQDRFNTFIQSSGYKVIGEYTDGPLTVTDYNQLIRYQSELYKLTAATPLDFTTTGNDATSWANDSAHFVSVGDAALRQELAAPGGAGLVGGVAKPVTWSGFAGGADPTGVNASDAAFIAAGASGETCYVPGPATYQLNTPITTGTWIISDGVTFTGTGGIQAQAIKLSPLINDYGLGKGGRWVSDANPAKIHRFKDRLFLGGSANNSGGISNQGSNTTSWLDDPTQTGLVVGHASLEQNATLACATESGLGGAVFASRASDYGLPTGGTMGLASLVLNDKDTTVIGGRPGGLAHYSVAILSEKANSNSGYSLTGTESNIWNQKLDASGIDPYNFFPSNLIKNMWLSNGFPENEHTRQNYDATCAVGILNNSIDATKGKYKVGIAFKQTSLAGTDGVTGRGIAMSLARGHSFQWYFGAGSQGPYINSSVDSSANEIQALVFTNFGTQLLNRANNKIHFLAGSIPVANNYPKVIPSVSGSAVRYAVEGDDADIDLQLVPKGAGVVKLGTSIVPNVDNARDFGSPELRGRTAYFGTGPINTSDLTHKPIREQIPENVLDAWAAVDWRTRFKFDDAIAEKGEDGARWHFGLIAQHVEEVFAAHGIDGFSMGLLCFDEWDDIYEQELQNEGETVVKTRMVEKQVVVTKTRTIKKQVMVAASREVLVDAEMEGGTKIKKVVTEEYLEPQTTKVYVFNEDGSPRIDESGKQVFVLEPVTEDVEEKYKDVETIMVEEEFNDPVPPVYKPVLITPAGNRYGIRYEEALSLEAALQRRNYERLLVKYAGLVSRIEALEGISHA